MYEARDLILLVIMQIRKVDPGVLLSVNLESYG